MQELEIEIFYAREHITRPHIYNASAIDVVCHCARLSSKKVLTCSSLQSEMRLGRNVFQASCSLQGDVEVLTQDVRARCKDSSYVQVLSLFRTMHVVSVGDSPVEHLAAKEASH